MTVRLKTSSGWSGKATDPQVVQYNGQYTTQAQTPVIFDMSQVTNASNYFANLRRFDKVRLDKVAGVTIASNMFLNSDIVTFTDQISWGNLTNTASMFSGCSRLTDVTLYGVSKLSSVSSMFYGVGSNPASPKAAPTNITFSGMGAIAGLANIFTSAYSLNVSMDGNINSTTNMFTGYLGDTLSLSMPQTSTTNCDFMFQDATNLKVAPTFNTSRCTSMRSMFRNCTALEEIGALDMKMITTTTAVSAMLVGSTNIKRIHAYGMTQTWSIANLKLDATALNEVFSNLGTGTGKTITITGNPGAATCDRSIATAKGWAITG